MRTDVAGLPRRSPVHAMRHVLALTLLAAAVAGCGGGPAPAGPRPEPENARAALVAALDAWKRGEVAGLTKRRPPVRFVDVDQVEGLKLAEYDIAEPDAPILPHKDVEVILSLRDPRGRVVRREATYQVATTPALSVLRSDR
ncbi:MAG: hypothetical protein U0835_03810 [Isosphaeraceae bacterium]